eukprot:scaffold16702_cov20-Tisochrysis_lutea.AAC.1
MRRASAQKLSRVLQRLLVWVVAASAAILRGLSNPSLSNYVVQLQNWSETNVDWFTSSAEERIALPEYRLTFLWQEKNIAVAVDQVYSRVSDAPVPRAQNVIRRAA